MRSVIIFVIVAFLSASYAEETTVEPIVEKTTDAPSLAEEPLITTLLAKTTVPTTIATSPPPTTTTASPSTTTPAPTTTTPTPTTPAPSPTTPEPSPTTPTPSPTPSTTTTTPAPTTTTPVPTTVQRRVTTRAPVSTTPVTTSAPSRSRSRSRVLKAQESDESYRQLIPIKVLAAGNSEGQPKEKEVTSAEPRQINIIRSSSTPSSRRSQLSGTPSTITESGKVGEKVDKSQRRGKVHYPTGRELGLDNPPVHYQSKYELDKYKFSYETKDGQTRAENGIFENMGTDDQNYVVKGSYSYFDADGIEFIVNYTADRKGYHPVITVKNPHRGEN